MLFSRVSAEESSASAKADAAVKRLIAAARLYDKREMAAASEQLAGIGKPAVPALIKAIDDFDDNVRWQAIVALGRIGKPDALSSVPTLLKALQDVDPDVRGAAAESLGQIEDLGLVVYSALERRTDDPHGMVRAQAYGALWKLATHQEAIPELVKLLGDKDWMVSQTASRHLGQIGKPALKPLVRLLENNKSRGRDQAAAALGMMGAVAKDAAQVLTATLSDKDPAIALAAADALGKIGPAAIEPLLRRAANRRDHARALAIVALAKIGKPALPATPVIIEALSDKRSAVQLAAIDALGRIGNATPEAVSHLRKLLNHRSEDHRGAAVASLGRLGPAAAAARGDLRRLAQNDPADFVRAAARQSLRTILNRP